MDVASFDTGLLTTTIERALRRGGDFAEIFVEDRESLGLRLEDGRIEQTSGGRETGAAVRLLSGERTYYAYSDAVDEAGLTAAADAVAAAVSVGGQGSDIIDLGAVRADPGKNPVLDPPGEVSTAHKAELVRTGDEAARAVSDEIVQAIVGYGDTRQRVLIANSLGDLVFDDRTRTRFTAQVVARRGEVIQTGHETVGGSAGFELVDEDIARRVARTAAEKARVMLASRPAPSGPMPVVLANGFGGTLFHEACGHGLEADAIAKGASIYAGKMGEVVAAPMVSAYDEGSITNGWGSQAFDDEGVPTQKTLVIEEGRLTGYLYDRLRAREAGAAPTGNGRRQSFRHVPIPRMTTTYIAPGDADRRRDHRRHAEGLLREEPGRWAGGAGQRQLRLRRRRGLPHRGRQDHDAAPRGHSRRQRHRHPHEDRHDRRRLRRQDRHLRQGRPGGAGGHWSGHASHRGDDGGRDGLMFDILDAVLERARRGARQTLKCSASAPPRTASRCTGRRSSSSPRRSVAAWACVCSAAGPWVTRTPRT